MDRGRPKYVPLEVAHTPRPRTVRERAPAFFRDVAHTRPTRWGLYRGLLRGLGGAAALAAAQYPDAIGATTRARVPAARVLRGSSWLGAFQGTEPPSAATRYKPALPAGFAPLAPLAGPFPHTLASLRARWRTARGWTSISDTRAFLRREEALLRDIAAGADVLAQREAALGSSYEEWTALPPPKRIKPLLTGGFLRPTLFSPPLPRMKPQPEHISMLITRRLQRRERRVARARWAKERQADMRAEVAFWRALGVDNADAGAWRSGPGELSWEPPLQAMLDDLDESFHADRRRAEAMFPPDMIERVLAARRRRDAWRVRRAQRRKAAAAAGGVDTGSAAHLVRPAATDALNDESKGSSTAAPSRERPRKESTPAKEPATVPSSGAKPRGRPRKTPTPHELDDNVDTEQPKRRGRPPKAKATAATALPRRRGRPPKTTDE